MNDSDATLMSESGDEPEMTDAEKWKNLPPAPRQHTPHPADRQPSEYGIPVGVDDHPLRRFYREAKQAEARNADERTTGARGDAR